VTRRLPFGRRRGGEAPARERIGRDLEPVSRNYGFERGKPVDRWYIEQFLRQNDQDVRGRVLELYEPTYTQWFGGDRVTHSEVLHHGDENPQATLIGDLRTGEGVPEGAFDTFIFTQTLHLIPDPEAAIRGTHRALAPGGVLLGTLPGISRVCTDDRPVWGDWWRFTTDGARKLFTDVYGEGNVEVDAVGNVLTAAAFLYGLSAEELEQSELEHRDTDYELLVTVRAVRR
jgi:SAM-dependent methyltransferase